MTKPLISIVIPSYNCAPYLQRCLDSIFAQVCAELNFEVICVDDASNDNSLAVLQAYACQQPIRIIALEKNAGPAHARNAGSLVAQGQYLWFFDSDDYLLPQAWQQLLTLIRQYPGQDLYTFGLETTQGSKRKIARKRPFRLSGKMGQLQGSAAILTELFAAMRFFPQTRILKREIWLQHPFPVGQWFEDISAVASATAQCQSCAWLATPLWHYYMRPDSTTGQMSPKACSDLFWCLRDFRERFLNSELRHNKELKFHLSSFLLKHSLDAICTLLTKEPIQAQNQQQAFDLIAQLPNILIAPMAQTQKQRLLRLRYKNWRSDALMVNYLQQHTQPKLDQDGTALYLLACRRQKMRPIKNNL